MENSIWPPPTNKFLIFKEYYGKSKIRKFTECLPAGYGNGTQRILNPGFRLSFGYEAMGLDH